MHEVVRTWLAWSLWVGIAVGLWPQAGNAQARNQEAPRAASEAQAPPAEYHAAMLLAYGDYKQRKLPEAYAGFLKAHTIFPNARSFQVLGKVAFDMQSFASSVENLQAALASDVRPLGAEERTKTEQLLEEACGHVSSCQGSYRIVLDPKSAQLHIDDAPTRLGPDGTLSLSVGEHRLSASALGYGSEQHLIQVRATRQESLEIRLVRQVEPEGEGTADQQTGAPVPLWKKWWVWTITGVVVAGAVTGLAVGLSHRDEVGAPTESNVRGVQSVRALRIGAW